MTTPPLTPDGDWQDPLLRRLYGLPETATPSFDDQFAAIKREGFARLREYEAMILRASAGEYVDADELLNLAASVARSPYRLTVDMGIARTKYLDWRNSINPV